MGKGHLIKRYSNRHSKMYKFLINESNFKLRFKHFIMNTETATMKKAKPCSNRSESSSQIALNKLYNGAIFWRELLGSIS